MGKIAIFIRQRSTYLDIAQVGNSTKIKALGTKSLEFVVIVSGSNY